MISGGLYQNNFYLVPFYLFIYKAFTFTFSTISLLEIFEYLVELCWWNPDLHSLIRIKREQMMILWV